MWLGLVAALQALQFERDANLKDRVTELTGLRLDPYFTGTKLTWLRENDPRAWAGVQSGQVAVGTVDSYLVARLTGGLVDPTVGSVLSASGYDADLDVVRRVLSVMRVEGG